MTADILAVFSQDQVLTPGDGSAYEDSIKRWADNAVKRARFIVLVKSAQDVAKAILFATENGLDVTAVCGGHSCSGASSSEDLVVDLRHLKHVTVDTEKMRITVGGGAVWADVDREAAKFGLAAVGGTVNHTGVGGLTVGGGFGWLSGRYGLVIDNLVQAEVVTASGDILVCDETENADLFWAIRGGGPNFGIVTSFVFKAYPQPNDIWAGLLVYAPTQLEALISAADSWSKTGSEDEGLMIFIGSPPPDRNPGVVAVVFFNGSAQEGKERFKAFFDLGPVVDTTKEMPYSQVNSILNDVAEGGRKRMKSAILATLDPALFQHVFEGYCALTTQWPETKGSSILIELHSYKKIMAVPKSATAFPSRGPYYNANVILRWLDPELDETMRMWNADVSNFLKAAQESTMGKDQAVSTYVNYGMGDERARDVFAGNYERLSSIKAKYDPKNVFNKWVNIAPEKA